MVQFSLAYHKFTLGEPYLFGLIILLRVKVKFRNHGVFVTMHCYLLLKGGRARVNFDALAP